MQSMKETAANIGASAKSGMEKTKATLQEKAEKMTTRDPLQKEMAERKKEDRITEAELRKQEEMNRDAAARRSETYSHSSTGEPAGMHHMSALPGHGTGEPAGQVVEGVVPSHPIGTATGTQRSSAADNAQSGAAINKGYGTGGAYS
ncbi:hypothetical protein NMG60_11001846 [Bertholletia excelsa]